MKLILLAIVIATAGSIALELTGCAMPKHHNHICFFVPPPPVVA
jgi:hypothetical protein